MSRPEGPGAGFDTHSPAWWRAQALAHEAAAGTETPTAEPAAPVAGSPAPTLGPPAPTPLDDDWVPSGPHGFHPAGPDPDTDVLHLPVVPPPTAQPAVSVLPEAGGVPRRRRTAPATATSTVTAASYAGFEALRAQQEPDQDEPSRGRALVGAGLALAGVSLGIGVLLWFGGGSGNQAAASRSQPASAQPAGGSPAAGTQLPGTQPSGTQPPGTQLPAPALSPAAAPPVAVAPVVVAPVVVPPAAPVQPAVLPLTVLNNSRYARLADRSAARFRAGGWSTAVVGNFTGRLTATTVYYGPGQAGSAQRFARQFGISRVLPRFAGLPGSGLTVVLTRDYV